MSRPDAQNRELVAAKACDDIAFGDGRAQPTGHFNQDRVAGRVAERIVDDLEVVEIEEQHRHGLIRLPAGDRFREFGVKHQSVEQAGQGIVRGKIGDLLARLLACRNVLQRHESGARRPPLWPL